MNDSKIIKNQNVTKVNLSDVNHELGKAKESLVYESGSYIDNFKSDAALVGSLIRYNQLFTNIHNPS